MSRVANKKQVKIEFFPNAVNCGWNQEYRVEFIRNMSKLVRIYEKCKEKKATEKIMKSLTEESEDAWEAEDKIDSDGSKAISIKKVEAQLEKANKYSKDCAYAKIPITSLVNFDNYRSGSKAKLDPYNSDRIPRSQVSLFLLKKPDPNEKIPYEASD